MRNASSHQGENERQREKKVNKNTYDISSKKRVTRKFRDKLTSKPRLEPGLLLLS